ncbi:MAG TPA: NAD-dependent epimerase [Bacteroidales bacterium]|nr:NAD-dependent epimerase [Bacteroidales bacterium]HPZ36472.1 NAD-dependent epimerase [Bacteroidales bacterium]HQD34819.1 NAD-dependent epimerase [Bacteroidales bacterium]
MKILVTGSAGFIGFHLTKKLLERSDIVVGIDNINNYYDVNLKYARLAETGIDKDAVSWNKRIISNKYPNYNFIRMNLEDKESIQNLILNEQFDNICHLAAQAGVRYSLENPYAYIDSNIVGFLNILEAARDSNIKHLVYASSSSVYGGNTKMPLSTADSVDHPISLYAATKKSNELMAHVYSHLFNIPTTGLRFFTVYGPWGRPDMALFLFTKSIFENKPIQVFNYGNMTRDFTFIDDIIEGVVKVIDKPAKPTMDANPDPSSSNIAPYKVYNIGNSSPVKLLDYIEAIENELGKKAIKEFLPMQPGDVTYTEADVSDLVRDFGYKPTTKVQDGIKEFIKWYKNFYNID